MNHVIQYQVDQLLLEQGEYQPLEFLLQEGRLSYNDYEAWRSGALDYLDEALFGDPEHIQQQLMQAEDYLQQRGWQAETISYSTWRNKETQTASQAMSHQKSAPLCFSANHTLNRCFHQRYRKPQTQPQLDLFTDAPATNQVNGITLALINLDSAEARRLLERLCDTAPDHVRLGELERLVEAAEGLHTAVSDVACDMQILQETLIPLAESLLGKDSRDLLILLWRRLSIALQDQPYQPSKPELHLSYTASQAMDWDAVRQAVEQAPHWQTNPVLLLRHARACDFLHQKPAAALLSWFKLCWQFPEQADAIESSSDYALRQQWITFLELDPELPSPSFPAWLLLNKPGLIRLLPEPGSKSDENKLALECPASYHTLYRLQHNRIRTRTEHGNEEDLKREKAEHNTMALRAQLKRQNPVLFHHFIGTIL